MSSCISVIILSHISSSNWCYVSRGRNIGLLHRSILTVKSLKRTLYSLPKTTLIYPYTPLHDVNVTSIYSNTRTHNSNLLYKTNLCFDLYLEEGRNRCGFLPPYSSFRSKIHIYSCSQHILMTTITPTTSIKVVSVFIANLKVFQNTDLRFNKFYILSSGKEIGNDVTFPGEGGLLHRSIRRVKSLKRTLYSLPK